LTAAVMDLTYPSSSSSVGALSGPEITRVEVTRFDQLNRKNTNTLGYHNNDV